MSSCLHTEAMLDGLLSQEDAGRALARLGIDPANIHDSDHRALLFALDRLFSNGYGTSAIVGFLEAPHPNLDWCSPSEVLCEPRGVDRVRALIAKDVAARHGRQAVVA